ncbi:hypothetical protein FHS18_006052 [Paenibacillus phyllosphaerae]|uniref:YvrJ family protein n=1 Tax=Paenibacillus phyllosphaerae TaxID=274593 RepID=A0A7W5FQY1_9BACL|nr:YvrJ family protein [Paenibacillus phyllosphaerae]MBB3113936.1 hypothetical protein [Paenibacillus phyllosphaerae]
MDQHILTLITSAVGDFGFPIVITAYLLLRYEKRIELLTTTVQELKQTMTDEGDHRLD